jgi:hypothetical protein
MSDFKGFEFSREYRFKEWLKFTRSKPFVCQPIMKNFWQCFDHFHFNKLVEESEAKLQCLEKLNYEECFKENSSKLFENTVLNAEEYIPAGAGGSEDEE